MSSIVVFPSELRFPATLHRSLEGCIVLFNRIDKCIAFKVKGTHPNEYCVAPTTGVIKPQSTCKISVKMGPQIEFPGDMKSPHTFVVLCFIMDSEELDLDKFNKEYGYLTEDYLIRVVYVPPTQPPSLLPEGYEPYKEEERVAVDEELARREVSRMIAAVARQIKEMDQVAGSKMMTRLSTEQAQSSDELIEEYKGPVSTRRERREAWQNARRKMMEDWENKRGERRKAWENSRREVREAWESALEGFAQTRAVPPDENRKRMQPWLGDFLRALLLTLTFLALLVAVLKSICNKAWQSHLSTNVPT